MSSFKLADLSLFPATREQTIESRKRTAPVWGKGQTIEQYLQRDMLMDDQDHAANGKLTTWVLSPRTDPTTLDFMCACETFRRPGAIARSHTTSGVQEVIAYGIASVFTPPSKRGHGYASHMMRLLHWVLAPRSALPTQFPAAWGLPPTVPEDRGGDAQFSVLYSDIGRDFYRTCGPSLTESGWLERGSMATILQPAHDVGFSLKGRPRGKCIWLTEDDVKLLYEHEAQRMKAELAETAAKFEAGHVSFVFLPHEGVGAFNIQRTMSFMPGLRPVLPTSIWGAMLVPDDSLELEEILSHSKKELPSFATWILEVRSPPRTLVVTRLRARRTSLPQVLDLLIEAARKENVEKIEIWCLPEDLRLIAEEYGWSTINRPEHLSAFKWYGQEDEDKVVWLFNEKFSWC